MMVASDSPLNQTEGCRKQLHHRSNSSFWIGYFRALSTPCPYKSMPQLALELFSHRFLNHELMPLLVSPPDQFASLDMRDE
jgi:hypothetical protein